MDYKEIPVADYSNEDPSKVLDSHSLIEAIHEQFDATTSHDRKYLRLRIDLLRDVFNLGDTSNNKHVAVIDRLLTGFGRIKRIHLLPFEGAMEVPDSIDTEAHGKIDEQFSAEIKDIRSKAYEIQRAYITYIVLHAIEPKLQSKTVTLSELHSAGLPQSDPGQDDDDW